MGCSIYYYKKTFLLMKRADLCFSMKQGTVQVWCKENTEILRNTADMNHFRIRILNAKHQFETCDVVIISCDDNVVSTIQPRDLAKMMIQPANI